MADKELNFKITGDTSGLSKATRTTKTEMRQASSVVRRSRTEYEKYADELEKVNRLERRGALAAGAAAKARQSLATSRTRGQLGGIQQLAGAAGLGGIVGAAGPLAAGIGLLTVATRQLRNVMERANQLRDTARTSGLPPEFIEALQRRGRRDRQTPRTTQAVQQQIGRISNLTGQPPREIMRQILDPIEGRPERERRHFLQQMFPGAGADVTRLQVPSRSLGNRGEDLNAVSNRWESFTVPFREIAWNHLINLTRHPFRSAVNINLPYGGFYDAAASAGQAAAVVNDMAVQDEF